jgi:hypothetical protein
MAVRANSGQGGLNCLSRGASHRIGGNLPGWLLVVVWPSGRPSPAAVRAQYVRTTLLHSSKFAALSIL